jgi:hypothetical protein
MNDPAQHPDGPKLENYPTLDFLGKPLSKEEANLIATGEIDPMTKTPYGDRLKIPITSA